MTEQPPAIPASPEAISEEWLTEALRCGGVILEGQVTSIERSMRGCIENMRPEALCLKERHVKRDEDFGEIRIRYRRGNFVGCGDKRKRNTLAS